MPRHHHSSRSNRNYKSEPDVEQDERTPARKFPILYIFLIIGGLFVLSLSISAVLLLGAPAKPVTKNSANSLRAQVTSPVSPAPPPTDAGTASVSAAPPPTSAAPSEAQAFALQPTSADLPSTSLAEPSSTPLSLAADDIPTKESLAESEFRARNYGEAERIYREILPSTPRQSLAVYRIYTCLLLQGRRADAVSLLTQAAPGADSPASLYCKATQAFIDGDTAAAQHSLDEARRVFPDLSASYDSTLKELGYLP